MQVADGSVEEPALQYVLAPLAGHEFFDRYFERQLLHVTRNSSTYYSAILTIDDLNRILSSNVFQPADLRIINSRSAVTPSDYALAGNYVDIARVRQLHARGSTILLTGADRYHAPLARLCSGLGTAFGATVGANVYVTPEREQGFGPHFDTHDVLSLQISGVKRWRIFGPAIQLPISAHDDLAARCHPSPDSDHADVELRPGDTLYVPRGIVHSPECIEGTSIHVSVHVLSFTWADLLRESLMQTVLSNPVYRHAIPSSLVSSGAENPPQEDHFRGLIRRFADDADFVKARGALAQQLATRKW